jgi:solute carrier family 25 phosphate transporter 23/24/25/41
MSTKNRPMTAPAVLRSHAFDLSNAEKTVFAGGLAGVVSKTLTAPLSRMVILYQTNALATRSPSSSSSPSLLSACRHIYRVEGMTSFWKGNLTSCIHRFPYSAINFTAYSMLSTYICENSPEHHESSSSRLWCGALAGAIACTVCYPLDLMRTRLTVQSSSYYRGIIHGIQRVIQEEGLSGLYKGLGMSLIVCVPSLAISFSVYGTLKQRILESSALENLFVTPSSSSDRRMNSLGSCLSGAASGISASLLLFPADVVRRRLQVRDASQRGAALSEMAHLLGSDGGRGLYRGILPELLKVAPMVGIQFTVYEFVLQSLGGLK